MITRQQLDSLIEDWAKRKNTRWGLEHAEFNMSKLPTNGETRKELLKHLLECTPCATQWLVAPIDQDDPDNPVKNCGRLSELSGFTGL